MGSVAASTGGPCRPLRRRAAGPASRGSPMESVRVGHGVVAQDAERSTSASARRGSTSATSMRFSVSVPVLSVAITVTAPSVSTALQPLDDGIALREAVGAQRQHHGDDDRQLLGDGGEGQRQAGEHHLLERLAAQHPEQRHEDAEPQRQPDQPAAELVHRQLQRRLRRLRPRAPARRCGPAPSRRRWRRRCPRHARG